MKNFSDTDYIKLEYKKINNLFLQGKFNLVIEKTKDSNINILVKWKFTFSKNNEY